MKIRTHLIGTGTNNDPYRVSFPTYNMMHCDYDTRTAIIEINESDCPSDLLANQSTYQHTIVTIPKQTFMQKILSFFRLHTLSVKRESHECLSPISIELLTAWHAHLDNRYQEHSGQFRHNVL